MRKVILQLHLIVALTAGIFIVILGVTGSIMAFEPEVDRLVPRIAYVTPHGTPLPLAQIGEAVSKAFPDHQIIGYALPARPDLSYGVRIARPQPPFRGQGVLIDQYSGRVLGTINERNFFTFVQAFVGVAHQLHTRLGMCSGRQDVLEQMGRCADPLAPQRRGSGACSLEAIHLPNLTSHPQPALGC